MDQATSELFHDLKRVLSSLEECLVEGGVGVVLEFWPESFRKGSRAFLGTITCKEESNGPNQVFGLRIENQVSVWESMR